MDTDVSGAPNDSDDDADNNNDNEDPNQSERPWWYLWG